MPDPARAGRPVVPVPSEVRAIVKALHELNLVSSALRATVLEAKVRASGAPDGDPDPNAWRRARRDDYKRTLAMLRREASQIMHRLYCDLDVTPSWERACVAPSRLFEGVRCGVRIYRGKPNAHVDPGPTRSITA